MTADQPLSENSRAWGRRKMFEYMLKKRFRTLSLNSEGIFRGTDNLYFILINFFLQIRLVLINKTGVPILDLFACVISRIKKVSFFQNLLFMPHCTEWALYTFSRQNDAGSCVQATIEKSRIHSHTRLRI